MATKGNKFYIFGDEDTPIAEFHRNISCYEISAASVETALTDVDAEDKVVADLLIKVLKKRDFGSQQLARILMATIDAFKDEIHNDTAEYEMAMLRAAHSLAKFYTTY